MNSKVKITLLAEDVQLMPVYATPLSAGADVRACLKEPVVIASGMSCLIPTGLKVSLPQGYELQVRPRSGLALKDQVSVLNTPGTIDADYRGEIGVILINHGKDSFVVTHGMRIAQLVLAPVLQADYILQEDPLETTLRGEGGFGHTGLM